MLYAQSTSTVISGRMASQASQHFKLSEKQTTCGGCFSRKYVAIKTRSAQKITSPIPFPVKICFLFSFLFSFQFLPRPYVADTCSFNLSARQGLVARNARLPSCSVAPVSQRLFTTDTFACRSCSFSQWMASWFQTPTLADKKRIEVGTE